MSTETSTQTTLDHHIQAFAEGIDATMQYYTEDSVLITPDATHRGLADIRGFFTAFMGAMPAGMMDSFKLNRSEVAGEVAYIVWEAKPWFPLGTDTFVVRDGKIVYQTAAVYAAPE
jgi:ketosteroid isomerase-like protein